MSEDARKDHSFGEETAGWAGGEGCVEPEAAGSSQMQRTDGWLPGVRGEGGR